MPAAPASIPACGTAAPGSPCPGFGPHADARPDRRLFPHLAQNRILRPGLSLHFGNEVEREDFTAHGVVDDCLRIVVVLEGTVDVAYGGHGLRLAAGRDARAAPTGPDAALVALPGPEAFRRTVRKGDFARRVSIGAGRQWIEQSLHGTGACVSGLLGHSLSASCWRASTHMRAVVEQMLNPPALQPELMNLYLESRALDLVIEACSRHGLGAEPAGVVNGLRPTAYRRMCGLKDWLREHAGMPLDLESIARQAGTSPATLQRQFRLAHGTTVFGFLHEVRLQRARQALESEGIAVRHAALMAGYANPANFATAFKRRYGLSPGQVRPRV